MKLRIASIAFLIASVSVGVGWLPLLPVLVRLAGTLRRALPEGNPELEALQRLWALLPLYLGLALALVAVLCYLLLHAMLGRPLRSTEQVIEQLERLDLDLPLETRGGPLLSRIQASLRRVAGALRHEQELTGRQLSELRRVNDELARAHTGLVSAERLATVGRLAAGVAHEVGNPLSGILGYVSLSKQRAHASPELLEYLGRIEHEVSRIDRIVRGLLDLGRPARLELSPVEVARLAETCVELVARGPDFEGVALELSIEPGTVARADPGPLSQVLINLLLNAAQAAGGKGRILVSGRREQERVVIDVEDSGPGLAPEVREHLFQPFFTTKAPGKGTGLGLAVCLHLVSAMGGELFAANTASGGARFTVRLGAA